MVRKIIVTGAAGLVGQNLVSRLKMRTELEMVGIDKHAANADLFRQMHPQVRIIEADLAQPGPWQDSFAGADTVVINQAQIGGLFAAEYEANNIAATKEILAAITEH